MKHPAFSLLFAFCLLLLSGHTGTCRELPDSVYVGGQLMHVQGIALDPERPYMYFSFTSRFVKTDLKGNILGSIDRIQGHLGALAFNPADRTVYASLECKDDEIGEGIARKLDVRKVDRKGSTFYVALIDVDKVDRTGMDPERDDVLRTVCIREACRDYQATVRTGRTVREHRFGCSGIDGITLAPLPGRRKGPLYVWVAYGIYSDVDRADNDHQVLLCFDPATLRGDARKVIFGTLHHEGPRHPAARYFVFTGNTSYGVQNLAWDPESNRLLLAVYRGKKPQFPNYDLFAVSLDQTPTRGSLPGVPYLGSADRLRPDLPGWHFRWGSTGLCPAGEGLWYISENRKEPFSQRQSCTARLYRWKGETNAPFEKVR